MATKLAPLSKAVPIFLYSNLLSPQLTCGLPSAAHASAPLAQTKSSGPQGRRRSLPMQEGHAAVGWDRREEKKPSSFSRRTRHLWRCSDHLNDKISQYTYCIHVRC